MKISIPYKKGDFRPLNFAMLVLSGLINATGVTLFLAPVNLYDSGISGTSMFMDVLVAPVPLWAWLIILNFPIFLFSLRQGLSFTVYSLFAIAMYSGFSAVYQNVIPAFVPDFFAKGSPIAGSDLLLCGIFGGLVGPLILRKLKIKSSVARGLAMGSAAHALGTSRALEMGAVEGAISGLAIGIMGVMVHAIRLNTLEFSNHVEMQWTGIKYRPFAKENKTEIQ